MAMIMMIPSPRHAKLALLMALLMLTFFLVSFNATLRFIVDSRAEQIRLLSLSSPSSSSAAAAAVEGESGKETGDYYPPDDADAYESRQKLLLRRTERMLKERGNPPPGMYRTTTRPLDGFAMKDSLGGRIQDDYMEEEYDDDDVDNDDDDDDGHGDDHRLVRRPPISSSSSSWQQQRWRGRSSSWSSSTNNVADAHYAKAMRMLSSNFDDTVDGGNALIHMTRGGEYDIGDGATRGDKFVRMEDYYGHADVNDIDRPNDHGGEVKGGEKKRTRRSGRRRRRNGRGKKGGGNRGRRRSRMAQRLAAAVAAASNNEGAVDADADDGRGGFIGAFVAELEGIAGGGGAAIPVVEGGEPPFVNILTEYLLDSIEVALRRACEALGISDYCYIYGHEDNDVGYEYRRSRIRIKGKPSSSSYIRREEDRFSWSDTRMGKALIWTYQLLGSSSSTSRAMGGGDSSYSSYRSSRRRRGDEGEGEGEGGGCPESARPMTGLSRSDLISIEGLYHLERAAELGHPEAQRMVANSLSSGILPLSDHSLMVRLAEWRYYCSRHERVGKEVGEDGEVVDGDGGNWTSIFLQSTVEIADDFSPSSPRRGGRLGDRERQKLETRRRGGQLSRAVVLWHLSAMSGNVESAMTLGYRHFYSAMGGSGGGGFGSGAGRLFAMLNDDSVISPGYDPRHGGAVGGAAASGGGSGSAAHYGVLGTCETALAYYEAAAHGVMDELENGPTKGKVSPPIDGHRLAEIYNRGGASVALEAHNKPDELEEVLQYYRMLASRNRSPEPDLTAAFTIANFYFNGYRGVKQDLRLALKYYEICGDYNHWEGGGLAGLMHVWGIGMASEERDLGKAYSYFHRGTPGGLDSCLDRLRKKKRQGVAGSKDGDVVMCDRHCTNGMGLLHLLGVEGLIDRDVDIARKWFEIGKDIGDPDSMYNYAMLRLGWMVTELKDLPAKVPIDKGPAGKRSRGKWREVTPFDRHSYLTHRSTSVKNGDPGNYNGPSVSDYMNAMQQLQQAASKGHLQAKHKLGMLFATGAVVPKKYGSPTKAVAQSCPSALRYFKGVADSGHTVSRRNRAAWKQYIAKDYESSLRNYLASAETGSEIGQVNAAFLLEQGHCLGMTRIACTHASIRLWRAAARQGNLEACLRVGDFYFYGRLRGGGSLSMVTSPPSKSKKDSGGGQATTLYDRDEYLSSLEGKALYFIPGAYRWMRYVLYPEELFALTKKWLSKSSVRIWRNALETFSSVSTDDKKTDLSPSRDACPEKVGEMCVSEWVQKEEHDALENKEEEYEHMAIAAQYYRKAAEEHNSARANFNLGFMHEWGLGLSQDFPLAKRHYDLAGKDNSNKAAAIALFAMNIHQKAVKFAMYLKRLSEGD
ncbi:hypothetical protein ACHAXA_003216 [Cyclostephanos tholiformis]|uniref:Uncharacterized protein n=1 Tax=Cyclostephanos tholiformis TaxID=382380 RepID=A0ABD3RYJ8_9STRA